MQVKIQACLSIMILFFDGSYPALPTNRFIGCLNVIITSHSRKNKGSNRIDLLAILQESLARALFLYIFIHEIRSSGVRASITIVRIRKFY